MISYSRDPEESIPSSAVKIIGLGGAGANMLERIALDSMEGAELLALNTDLRTLGSCLAKEKIQLGTNLTKGLGTGGDPELGQQAMLEAEEEVRKALKGQRIVFLCTGLGGGTGSGAAPIVSRIAREEGAFVVVFATMPFFFEGRRRREQAETSLNQLAVLANALVTFDNNRMGELVLAKQGIHEAFGAADRMISESIKAVIRLVIRPGLINVGLDDLMSALRTTRSRCLFGSGIADGKDRASKALRNALSSPLLDQGSLLKEAQTVLVHLSGGESLTLFEIELLMRSLQKHVPESAHVLFGAAIDPAMGDNLSITLISALPEDALTVEAMDSISSISKSIPPADKGEPTTPANENPFSGISKLPKPEAKAPEEEIPKEDAKPEEDKQDDSIADSADGKPAAKAEDIPEPTSEAEPTVGKAVHTVFVTHESVKQENVPEESAKHSEKDESGKEEREERPFAEFDLLATHGKKDPVEDKNDEGDNAEASHPAFTPEPKNRASGKPLWGKSEPVAEPAQMEKEDDSSGDEVADEKEPAATAPATQLKLDSKHPGSQSELSFENAPRGRFEGENPNVFEGEDLDLPPFLRKKKP
jgi:cell division protein FtsZ